MYTNVCVCRDNYAGVDCSRCKYGHYGTNCNQKQVLPRINILTFNDADWAKYIDTLKRARTYPSGYKVILQETNPATTGLQMADINLYDLFVWLHHYAAKDNECPGKAPHY